MILGTSLHACSEDGGSEGTEGEDDVGTHGTGSTTDGGSSDAETASGTSTPTCEGLAFVASGEDCGSCELECDCADGFPISLAVCTDDGCLVEANCDAVCAAGLEFSFGCKDVYGAPLGVGEPCDDAPECASKSCLGGVCVAPEPLFVHAWSPLKLSEVTLLGLRPDSEGVRLAVALSGSFLDAFLLNGPGVVAVTRAGEVRWAVGVTGDLVAMEVADADETVVLGRFDETVTVDGFTPSDGDEDLYIARYGQSIVDRVWTAHLPTHGAESATATRTGDAFVVLHMPDETDGVEILAYDIGGGALLSSESVPASGAARFTGSPLDERRVVFLAAPWPELAVDDEAVTTTAYFVFDTETGALTHGTIDVMSGHAGWGDDGRQVFGAQEVSWTGDGFGSPMTLGDGIDAFHRFGGVTAAYVGGGGNWRGDALESQVLVAESDAGSLRVGVWFPDEGHVAVGPDGVVYVGGTGRQSEIAGEHYTDITQDEPDLLFLTAFEGRP